VAQRAVQLRQEVATHFSSGTVLLFIWEGKAAALSNGLMICLAPIAAPANPDSLRNVLLFNFNLVCFFSFEPDMLLFFISFFLKELIVQGPFFGALSE
jgi:hypothetical protein